MGEGKLSTEDLIKERAQDCLGQLILNIPETAKIVMRGRTARRPGTVSAP